VGDHSPLPFRKGLGRAFATACYSDLMPHPGVNPVGLAGRESSILLPMKFLRCVFGRCIVALGREASLARDNRHSSPSKHEAAARSTSQSLENRPSLTQRRPNSQAGQGPVQSKPTPPPPAEKKKKSLPPVRYQRRADKARKEKRTPKLFV